MEKKNLPDPMEIMPIVHAEKKEPGIDSKIKDITSPVVDFWINDIIKPGIRSMAIELLHGSIDTLFGARPRSYSGSYSYGGSSSGYRNRTNYASSSRYSYASRSSDREDGGRPKISDTEMVFHTRKDAEDIIDEVIAALDSYGTISVAHFKAMCGRSEDIRKGIDSNWGWNDVRGYAVTRYGGFFGGEDGYCLSMPPVIYIN